MNDKDNPGPYPENQGKVPPDQGEGYVRPLNPIAYIPKDSPSDLPKVKVDNSDVKGVKKD